MIRTVVWMALVAFSLETLSACTGPRQEIQDTAALGNHVPSKWEASGIEVVRIKPAANGMMLDLRYRVINPERAREIIKPSTQITLIDQASGVILPIPNMAKVGKLRNLPNSNDMKTLYWIFFDNSYGKVKPGSKVTLVIGELKLTNINVE